MPTAVSTQTTAGSARTGRGVTAQPHSFTVFGERTLNTPPPAIAVFTPLWSLPSHSPTLILTKGLRSSPERALLREPGSERIHSAVAEPLSSQLAVETRAGIITTNPPRSLRRCSCRLSQAMYGRAAIVSATQEIF